MAEPRQPLPNPVLVVGMHRSGTALIARMLDRLGVFMGQHLDPNHEPYVLIQLHDFILGQAGARWDHPEPARALIERADLRRLMTGYLRFIVRTPHMLRYWGWKGILRSRSVFPHWGWKDPRTTLLLPLWLDIFPAARLVHVRRHGVDVAASLRARHETVLQHAVSLLEEASLYSWQRPFRPFIDTVRASTLEGGFQLWEYYLSEAAQNLAERNFLELRYESVVTDPVSAARRLDDHLGLKASEERILEAAAIPQASRALVFRRDPELNVFAETVAGRLQTHGYSAAD